MTDLKTALVIGRATYERWLGTEPNEIEAAAAALRAQEPAHPMLTELEIRARQARRVKRVLERAIASVRAERPLSFQ
jgi:hypothetical protein